MKKKKKKLESITSFVCQRVLQIVTKWCGQNAIARELRLSPYQLHQIGTHVLSCLVKQHVMSASFYHALRQIFSGPYETGFRPQQTLCYIEHDTIEQYTS